MYRATDSFIFIKQLPNLSFMKKATGSKDITNLCFFSPHAGSEVLQRTQ